MEDSTTDLSLSVTGSLSVNRYRWINIWMAILGHIFTSLPVFFEMPLILLLNGMEIFPDTVVNVHIYILLFSRLIGIKRRARLIPISTRHFHVSPLPAGLKLCFGLLVRSYRAAVEVIRDNEPLYSADFVVPFWREHTPRNPHFCFAYQPMLYPFRRFSGLQSR